MAHHKLREDKECQNCGYTVEKAYCSQCGQHNVETRQSFINLATHIVEDITHYDGNFWKSIKYLLFRPGKLTIEYLQGHRMRYVPPVKLYIFISFVCFFIMALMAPEAEEEAKAHEKIETTEKNVNLKLAETDIKLKKAQEDDDDDNSIEVDSVKVYSVKQLDSLQDARPEDNKIPILEYYTYKVSLKSMTNDISARDFIIGLSHTLPKILFLYMPIFAFWLWLLHGKKRWYFFDHGIYTLHYFSFLLLLITINMIISWLAERLENYQVIDIIAEIIKGIVGTASMFYSFFYFFRSHRRFYGETKAISRLKSLLLFIINVVLISFLTLGTLMYIILNMH